MMNLEVKENGMVNGLGIDNETNRYYTLCYAWNYQIPNLIEDGTFEAKSGITRHDVHHAMRMDVRHKQYSQIPMWGFESDRKYLPEGITVSEANSIVLLMDETFKKTMSSMGWTKRTNKRFTDVGTEFYTGPKDTWLETIKSVWDDSFNTAVNTVIPNVSDLGYEFKDIQFLANQAHHVHLLSQGLDMYDSVRGIYSCSYGKGTISFALPFKTNKGKECKVVVYYTHNIPATQKLAAEHRESSNKTKYKGTFRSITVCSDDRPSNKLKRLGVESVSVSDPILKQYIKEAILSKSRTFFYVNNLSAGTFSEVYNKVSSELNYSENVLKVIDESQNFTGNKSSAKTQAVVNPIKGYQVSLTATEVHRNLNNTNSDNKVFNDDVEYFGFLVSEVSVVNAINEERSCPIHFKSIGINSNNSTLAESIQNNRAIQVFLKKSVQVNLRGNFLRALTSVVYAIRKHNRNHILLVTREIKETEALVNRALPILKSEGIIPSDFEIISALRKDGLEALTKFNNSNKAICVGTSWLITGMNAPKIDGLITLGRMHNTNLIIQYIGRGQRPHGTKELNVYIHYDASQTEDVPMILTVAAKIMEGEMVHHVPQDNEDVVRPEVLGSRSTRAITFEDERDSADSEEVDAFWEEVITLVEEGETMSVIKLLSGYRFKGSPELENAVKACSKFKNLKDFIIEDKSNFETILSDGDLVVICLSKMEDVKNGPKNKEELENLKFDTIDNNRGPLTDFDITYLNTFKEHIEVTEKGINKQKEEWVQNLMN